MPGNDVGERTPLPILAAVDQHASADHSRTSESVFEALQATECVRGHRGARFALDTSKVRPPIHQDIDLDPSCLAQMIEAWSDPPVGVRLVDFGGDPGLKDRAAQRKKVPGTYL